METEEESDSAQQISLQKIQHGDFSEFEKLYQARIKNVYSYAYKTLRNQEDTEEVVQEVFTDFWQQRNKIQSDRILWIMTKRKCIDLIRKKKNTLHPEDWNFVYDSTCKQEQIIDAEEHKQKMLEKLTQNEKEILTLLLEEHSRNEIAKILKIPLGTVDSRLHRLKQKLKG